jgi:hypothetical protein
MRIIIENHSFGYDLGCKLLKLKYTNCPEYMYKDIGDIWDDIIPITFEEISRFTNIEERRIGILCLGLERLIKEIKPKLEDKKIINKTTTWVVDGKLVTKEYKDIYKLYYVKSDKLNKGLSSNWGRTETAYFVKFKDTSTEREYMIWIDAPSVLNTNNRFINWMTNTKPEITAVEAIAWTIQTNIPKGNIANIIRQGDCILIKPKGKYNELLTPRHLTGGEYLKLLTLES